MATFTCNQYFTGRVPDIATLLPGYNVDMAVNAAMALYWNYLFPDDTTGALDESRLSERQKVMIALRAVVSAVPVFTKALTKPQVIEATAVPVTAKFEERNKLYKYLLALWEDELEMLEGSEGICFSVLPNVPAYLKALECDSIFPSSGYVFSNGTYFVREN